MAGERAGNAKLAAMMTLAGWSHAQAARALARVAVESGAEEWAGISRSHVSHWVGGTAPSGRAPQLLCEALARRLGRPVTLHEVGLTSPLAPGPATLDWRVDTLVALGDLGRLDVDMDRRHVLESAIFSVAGLALPENAWWQDMLNRADARRSGRTRIVGRADVDAVQDMVSIFSKVDQRRGGGHARTAVAQYLTTDVSAFLNAAFPDRTVRQDLFSAASELAYLCGWMAFDNSEHAIAQHYFAVALKLAAEADDPPMAGHILRAMAHQAVDLGHHTQALELATASVDGQRYTAAAPRERALLGVVHARALAVTGHSADAATALLRAENDLAAARPGDDEPARVFFFGEASLAHETACALRDLGDLSGATVQFQRSVKTRQAAAFTRTHAVTLGYLGHVQARGGNIDQACETWSQALNAMDGIRSGRTRQVAQNMRAVLAPLRPRGVRRAAEVDERAAAYVAHTR
jgi:tetratricopeptide (TPR) repeat protein